MKIEHRICTSDIRFRCLLDEHNIPYKQHNSDFSILKICESDPKWPVVNKYIAANDIFSVITLKFSQSEMDNAEWFVMRSKWHWEYPMPDNNGGYINLVYNIDNWCKDCGSGFVQKDLFRIRKSPKWGNKHFLMLNWVEDELFISEKAKQVLNNSSLKGFEFLNVLKAKSETKLDDIYQLKITETLQSCFLPIKENIKKQTKCPICGATKYIPSGKGYSFNEKLLNNNVDIVKTSEKFGAGALSANKILVSKGFYKTILANKLDRGLEFIPINLN